MQALGVGRIGAVLGPIVGGLLVGAGVSIGGIFTLYTVPTIVAAVLCLAIRDADLGALLPVESHADLEVATQSE